MKNKVSRLHTFNHSNAEVKSISKNYIAETLGETFLNNSCSKNALKKNKVKEQKKINSISSRQTMRNIIVFLFICLFGA